jgi:hypothetical protein
MITSAACTVRVVAMVMVAAALAGPAWGQPASPGVSDYSSFDAGAVVSEAARLKADGLTDQAAQHALARRAATLVLEVDAPQGRPTEAWNQLATLAALAIDDLPPEQREPLRDKLLGGASAGAPAEWADLQARVLLVSAVDTSGQAATALVDQWLQSHDLNSLSISELQFCIKHCLPSNAERKAFTVTWTGMLAAPRTGAYKFSTTPINVNKQFGTDRVRHTLVATVGSAAVLNAVPPTPEELRAQMARRLKDTGASETQSADIVEWPFEGAPVQLQAGQAVPIRVEMTYECTQPNPADMPTAILCWEGPGMSRQPVFKEALSTGDGAAPGLRSEYRWQEHGEPRTAVVESSVVDFAWASPASVAPSNPELLARLSERYWELAIDPAYLEACAAGDVVHAFVQDDDSTAGLSAAQRQAFLELATNNAALLDRLTDEQLLLTYRKLRFGAEEQAIDFVGHWMQQHANVAPEFSLDFFEANRRPYSALGELLAYQLPLHLDELNENYLELDDGRCSLSAAYALAYGHLMNGAAKQWIEHLSAKLADDSLAAEQRINWLLARAMTAEIAGPSPRRDAGVARFPLGKVVLSAGRGWLDEASLIAEHPETIQRVQKERLARRLAQREWALAEREIADSHLPRDWHDQLVRLKDAAERQAAQERSGSQAALLAEFSRRSQLAEQRGDRAEAERYQQLVDAAPSE